MSCFDVVTLTWGGKDYVVQSDKVMGLVETIECIITLDEINDMLIRKTILRAKIARAYSAVLNYAGAKVSQEEVYAEFFGEEMAASTLGVLSGLLAMMIPPEHLRSKQNPKT
jgi:hypothetical protein